MRISPDVLHLETSRVQIEVHVYQEVQRTTPVERRMGQELLSTIDDWVHAMLNNRDNITDEEVSRYFDTLTVFLSNLHVT